MPKPSATHCPACGKPYVPEAVILGSQEWFEQCILSKACCEYEERRRFHDAERNLSEYLASGAHEEYWYEDEHDD